VPAQAARLLGPDHSSGLARAVDEGVGNILISGFGVGGRIAEVGVRAERAGIERGEGRPAACRSGPAQVGLQVGLTVAAGEQQLLAGRRWRFQGIAVGTSAGLAMSTEGDRLDNGSIT